MILTFLNNLLSSITLWLRKLELGRYTFWRALHASGHQLTGRRVKLTYFRPKYIWTAFRFFTEVNVFVLITLALMLFLTRGLMDVSDLILGTKTSSWGSLTWMADILVWIFNLSALWNLLLLFNHWNDITSLFASFYAAEGGNIITQLGSIGGYLYVTNFSFIWNFLNVLFTNPSEIGNSKVVLEFLLLKDNIEAFGILCKGLVLNINSSDLWSHSWLWVCTQITYVWTQSTGLITGILASIWSGYIGWIHNSITPIVGSTLLQGVISNITMKVATGLGISLFLFLIRLIIGL